MNQTSVLLSQLLTTEFEGAIKTAHYKLVLEEGRWVLYYGKKYIDTWHPDQLDDVLTTILAMETALKTSS